MSAVVCIMSVLNEVEAAVTCSKDADCKAVVLGQEQTWTGLFILLLIIVKKEQSPLPV